MKNFLTLLFITLFALNLRAEKLTIIHEDWAEAQKLASESNKLIIIDFYTTWCGPCKMFSKNLEGNRKLQSKLSKNFIMLKYDAEKDKKFGLSKKFHVRSYPTFVIVSPTVQYADRLVGGALESESSIDRFVAFTENALEIKKNGTFPVGYIQKLENDYPSFYKAAMDGNREALKEGSMKFWEKNNDYLSEVSFAVMSAFGGSEQADAFFLKEKDRFREKFGKSAANQILDRMVNKRFWKAIKQKDEEQFEKAKTFAIRQLGDEANIEYMEYSFAMETKDCSRMEKVVDGFIEKNEMAAMSINSVCWQIYESDCSNASLLGKATKWMKTAKPLTQGYAFLDTYACLLYKNKQYRDAKTYMQRAIAKAKDSGEDHAASLKVLEKIENALK